MAFDPQAFRADFPYFQQPDAVTYLDSAATALKPHALLQATMAFYQSAGSVHRSQYDEKQTALFEQARERVKTFIHAKEKESIIWTSGTTQAINLVASGLAHKLNATSEIIISEADHHANFVTWSEIARQYGAKLHILPINDQWLIEEQTLIDTLNENTLLIALNAVSNVTGTAQPIKRLITHIRQHSHAWVLVDAAQAISHTAMDLQALDADFLAFSAHKLYGPNGLGVLSGKRHALEQLQPALYGGKMVAHVSAQQIRFADLPYRLEAGTPNIAGVIGFNAVLGWLEQWDLEAAEKHTVALAQQCQARLATYPNCQLFRSPQPSSVVCFVFNGIATSDLATLLAEQHIALRAGEHCAQPYLARLGQRSTLRLSFAPYNQQEDVDTFFHALDKALALLD
ncbi:aminotransferase class V-fold PLP-dependent enzyme [Pasteurella sp. PK-2025]|uniref:aminotransferase class V-fold PLP-dependent enzyme n=1 Tax=Pasteurella sp. PK-2025 TaxID=3413133 RepID=UPI003C724211